MKPLTALLASALVAALFAGCLAKPRPSQAPLVTSARNEAARRCQANLRQIQLIKEQWAQSEHKSPQDEITRQDIMRIDRYLLNAFECDEGGTYRWGRVGEPATCTVTGHTLQ